MDLTDRDSIERAAEFTYMEQGIPGLGEMPTLEAYKLGFVAGMRLAGEEILKIARDKAWTSIPLEQAEFGLEADKIRAISEAISRLQEAGLQDVKLLARGGELRIGWQ